MSTNITFNSYDIQTNNLIASGIVHENIPRREIQTEDMPRRHGLNLVRADWKEREITVTATLVNTSQSNAETALDTLKENLIGLEQNLDIAFAGGTRRYKATLEDIQVNREHYHISMFPYILKFVCVDPFGYATSSTNHSDDEITSSPHTSSVSITGSWNPLPVITLTIQNETTMTAIKFENTTTEDSITVTRAFADSEVLEIDCENMTVEVDSTAVDYTGVFPEFVPNSNGYKITITDGGSFDVDLDIDYTATYI